MQRLQWRKLAELLQRKLPEGFEAIKYLRESTLKPSVKITEVGNAVLVKSTWHCLCVKDKELVLAKVSGSTSFKAANGEKGDFVDGKAKTLLDMWKGGGYCQILIPTLSAGQEIGLAKAFVKHGVVLDPTDADLLARRIQAVFLDRNKQDISYHRGKDLTDMYVKLHGTNLGSCMTGAANSSKIAIYADNPECVAMAIVHKGDKKIGRALLWGNKYFDTIYPIEHRETKAALYASGYANCFREAFAIVGRNTTHSMPYFDGMGTVAEFEGGVGLIFSSRGCKLDFLKDVGDCFPGGLVWGDIKQREVEYLRCTCPVTGRKMVSAEDMKMLPGYNVPVHVSVDDKHVVPKMKTKFGTRTPVFVENGVEYCVTCVLGDGSYDVAKVVDWQPIVKGVKIPILDGAARAGLQFQIGSNAVGRVSQFLQGSLPYVHMGGKNWVTPLGRSSSKVKGDPKLPLGLVVTPKTIATFRKQVEAVYGKAVSVV